MNYLFTLLPGPGKRSRLPSGNLLPSPHLSLHCLPEHLPACAWEEGGLEHDSSEELAGWQGLDEAALSQGFSCTCRTSSQECALLGRQLKYRPPLPPPFGALFAREAASTSLLRGWAGLPLHLPWTSERMNWLQSTSQSETVVQSPPWAARLPASWLSTL